MRMVDPDQFKPGVFDRLHRMELAVGLHPETRQTVGDILDGERHANFLPVTSQEAADFLGLKTAHMV